MCFFLYIKCCIIDSNLNLMQFTFCHSNHKICDNPSSRQSRRFELEGFLFGFLLYVSIVNVNSFDQFVTEFVCITIFSACKSCVTKPIRDKATVKLRYIIKYTHLVITLLSTYSYVFVYTKFRCGRKICANGVTVYILILQILN